MKALLVVLLVFAMVSMKGFRGAEAGTEANPSCCFPPAFMSSYEYFANNSGFQVLPSPLSVFAFLPLQVSSFALFADGPFWLW